MVFRHEVNGRAMSKGGQVGQGIQVVIEVLSIGIRFTRRQYSAGMEEMWPDTVEFRSIVILPLHGPPEGGRFAAADEFEVPHPSPKVGQWHSLCSLGALDFGKEYRVRPARYFLGHAALDDGQCVVQQRDAEFSIRDAHAAELVRVRSGE